MPKASHSEYGEKRINRGYTLTPTAAKMLAEKAAKHGISASDFIEKVARDEIPSSILKEHQLDNSNSKEMENRLAALEEKVNALLAVIKSAIVQSNGGASNDQI